MSLRVRRQTTRRRRSFRHLRRERATARSAHCSRAARRTCATAAGAGNSAARSRRRRAQSEVHLRPLRDRVVEPLRARGSARRCRSPRAGVQPALHLRRNRARQDAPTAGDRPLRAAALAAPDRALCHERDLHERVHRRGAGAWNAHRGLQAALPQLRRPPRRRHPVHRGQGTDPGGVLPHVQLPLRRRRADHHLVGPPSCARSRRWRNGSARGSSGAFSPTSRRPTSRRASRSCASASRRRGSR